ncbi:ROK family protein [Rahnella woolbedingensis]|nr:ROK family transcriptional regulator [Rahnella woolbedingensis]
MFPEPIFPDSPAIDGNDPLRLFLAIQQGHISSRRDAVVRFGMRSTTVSEHIAALIEQGLVIESATPRQGRGRPSISLVVNPHRIVVLVFKVVSQYLQVVCVNLAGQILQQEQMLAPADGDNSALQLIFKQLHAKVRPAIPAGALLAGISFSLPGLLDRQNARWVFCARWPRMKQLALDGLFADGETPLAITRTMDAELIARQVRSPESTLLLHWGYGVGMAFAKNGVLAEGGYGFGEVGHWRTTLPEQKLCCCGNTGCLETWTALWALGPELLQDKFNLQDDEIRSASLFKTLPLTTSSTMQRAVSLMGDVVDNLCRLFFPQRIIISGPFMANPGLWAQFYDNFMQRCHFIDMPVPELIAGHRSHEFEIYGAARGLLEQGLLRLIR